MLLWLAGYICNCLAIFVCLVVGFRPRFQSAHLATSEVSCLERQTTVLNIRSDQWPPERGGESLNFESFQAGSDVKSQTFKIPIKLYTRNKKIIVQGTPDCQILFMKYFKEFSAFGHSTPLKTKKVELLQPETKISEDANTAKSTSKEAESFVLPTTTQFSTPKNSSTTTIFLERSSSFLSPSRIAQISQTIETVGRMEAEFATFKLSIERRLLETIDSQLFQDKIYSLTQSNNLETKTLKSRINDLNMAKETLSHKVKTLEPGL